MALGSFIGNIWADAKAAMGLFIDERANERQREALQMIFGGQAGGWPGLFAKLIAEVRGIEYVPIQFEVAMIWRIGGQKFPEKWSPAPRRSVVRLVCGEARASTQPRRFGSWSRHNRHTGQGDSRSSPSLRLQMGLAGPFQ
jgi:hypothetical protein